MTTMTTPLMPTEPSGRDLLAQKPQPKGGSTALAIVVLMAAFGVALFAFLFTSSATAGPTIMGFALLLGIVARMMQASAYDKRR